MKKWHKEKQAEKRVVFSKIFKQIILSFT